jgi:hypothetical protein
MYILGTGRHGELVESLKRFLNDRSAAPPAELDCANCGAALSYLQTQFWLEGGDQGWNIQLPYCPNCHPLPASKETFLA